MEDARSVPSEATPATGSRRTTGSQELEIARLVLELIHLGYREGGAGESRPGHVEGAGELSRQARRAAIQIYVAGGLTMGELAAKSGMTPGWASRVVEELVAVGYVERLPDPNDRRIIRVNLTPESARAVEQAYSSRNKSIERALDGMDEREREAVRTFLTCLNAELSAG